MADKFIDKNETLALVMDRKAIDGKIAVKGIAPFIKSVRHELVVDQVSGTITLHGKSLDAAVDDILNKDADFWAPKGGEENHQREVVEEEVILAQLKRDALSGNVTAHGRLRVRMGTDAEYAAWCAETGAKPGVAIVATEVNGSVQHAIKKPAPTNPFSAAGWNITKQGQLVKALGVEKATEIAAAAGCKLGSTRPNPHYN